MEIQKIFSDVDEEEKLYSVLINEEEFRLFSELEERLYGAKKIGRRRIPYKPIQQPLGTKKNPVKLGNGVNIGELPKTAAVTPPTPLSPAVPVSNPSLTSAQSTKKSYESPNLTNGVGGNAGLEIAKEKQERRANAFKSGRDPLRHSVDKRVIGEQYDLPEYENYASNVKERAAKRQMGGLNPVNEGFAKANQGSMGREYKQNEPRVEVPRWESIPKVDDSPDPVIIGGSQSQTPNSGSTWKTNQQQSGFRQPNLNSSRNSNSVSPRGYGRNIDWKKWGKRALIGASVIPALQLVGMYLGSRD